MEAANSLQSWIFRNKDIAAVMQTSLLAGSTHGDCSTTQVGTLLAIGRLRCDGFLK